MDIAPATLSVGPRVIATDYAGVGTLCEARPPAIEASLYVTGTGQPICDLFQLPSLTLYNDRGSNSSS